MTLRAKLIAYLVAVHFLFAAIALWTLRDRPVGLLAAEAVLLISAVTGVSLVGAWIVPMRLVRSGPV